MATPQDAIARVNRFWLVTGVVLAAVVGASFWAARGAPVPVAATVSGLHAEDAVQQALKGGMPTVVEFGSNACVACREMKPILAAIAREHRGKIAVLDIDIIKQPDYIARYKIQLMPTQVFFSADGRELGRNMGKISGEGILAKLGATVAPAPAPPRL